MSESGPNRGLVSRALRGTGGFRWNVNEEIGQSSQRRDNHHRRVRAELEDFWGKLWHDP